MANRLGSKPEDLLWVWASETAYNPALTGGFRTISTLSHAGVVPDLLTEDEWATLPTLTPTQQLPFIERFYKKLTSTYLGRGFQDTFEAYLANAAPGLLRADGQYNVATTMYGDPNQPAHTPSWQANWVMDTYPVAVTEGQKRGISQPMPERFGELLVGEGLQRGWITLGDLKAFMLRPDVAAVANPAIAALHAAPGSSSANQPASFVDTTATATAAWTPDTSKSLGNPQAPIDTRVAPSAPTPRSLLSAREAIVIGALAWFLMHVLRR